MSFGGSIRGTLCVASLLPSTFGLCRRSWTITNHRCTALSTYPCPHCIFYILCIVFVCCIPGWLFKFWTLIVFRIQSNPMYFRNWGTNIVDPTHYFNWGWTWTKSIRIIGPCDFQPVDTKFISRRSWTTEFETENPPRLRAFFLNKCAKSPEID